MHTGTGFANREMHTGTGSALVTINDEIINQIGIRDNEETVTFLGKYIDPHNVEKTYNLGQLKNSKSYLRN